MSRFKNIDNNIEKLLNESIRIMNKISPSTIAPVDP